MKSPLSPEITLRILIACRRPWILGNAVAAAAPSWVAQPAPGSTRKAYRYRLMSPLDLDE